MSSNGTLTYYDKEKSVFKTVYIHHIENNYSNDINSLTILNKHYQTSEKARNLVNKGGLSYFDKKEIVSNDGVDEIYVTKSIEELIKITNSWSSSNYVYFLDYWHPSPIDVQNRFYKDESFNNNYEETSHYNVSFKTYELYISKNSKMYNMNISKVIVLEEATKKTVSFMYNKDRRGSNTRYRTSRKYL